MENFALLLGLLLVFLGFVNLVILQGLRKIPADPPHKAVCTSLGERTGGIKNEGWRFFLIYPWLNGYIPVNVTRINQDLKPEDVRTAEDMAEIEVQVSLTWRPDYLPDSHGKTCLIYYLNSGGESGVRNILADVVNEAVREFAADPDREPNTWEDAVKMRKDFLAEIVLSILGHDPQAASQEEVENIVAELRRGNGSLRLQTLGIILSRVNVTKIQPMGKLREAAQLEAREKRERKAEIIELRHVAARTEELKKLGLSNEQALEIIQTERGKVQKTINESKWNVSQETRQMIEKIGPDLVAKILKRGKNG